MRYITPPPSKTETVRGICYLLFQLLLLPVVLSVILGLLGMEQNLAQLNLVYYAVNFLAVLVIFRDFLAPNLDRFAEVPLHCGLTCLFGLGRYFVYSYLATSIVLLIAPDFVNANDAVVGEMIESDLPLMVVGLIFLVPPAEECLFRGLIFRNLIERNRTLAYILSAVAFSALHLIGHLGAYAPMELLAAFIQYLPAGLCLAWAYERSGTILTPILIHATINAMGVYTMRTFGAL